MQNSAAHIVTCKHLYEHIISAIKQLYWLTEWPRTVFLSDWFTNRSHRSEVRRLLNNKNNNNNNNNNNKYL